MATAPRIQPSPKRIALGWLVRLTVTALVFGYLLRLIDVRDLWSKLQELPRAALLGSLTLSALAATAGFLRWRALLRGYGAQTLPSYLVSGRIYGAALFYNLLPGAVGGDVYRGYATRQCFADGSATRSMSVVFVERMLGFSGLLMLASVAALLSAHAEPQVLFYSALGLGGATTAILAISFGQRLSGLLPAPIARITRALPTIQRVAPCLWALALSVMTHVFISLAGHVLIHSLVPRVTLVQSFATFPVGTLAAYFPLTVAGAGARETALVEMFARLNVPREAALATSLCLLVCSLIIAGLGGLSQLAFRGQVEVTAPANRTE